MQTARTFLPALRLRLRCNWLVFLRDLTALVTKCRRCKRYGAYPCSIAACVPLCEHCAREESIKLDRRPK
jgi:hypothetical protein